jgi:phenylpyruvate tautomerase PptA (4-oxalocrotonate tautomerase family)
MPIVDIELVCESAAQFATASARELADALGSVFSSAPGHTWVRLRRLDSAAYAENRVSREAGDLPTFVTVMHAHPPTGARLEAEAAAVTESVAACLARAPEHVHVQYAPPGAGRQAFGGRLVR